MMLASLVDPVSRSCAVQRADDNEKTIRILVNKKKIYANKNVLCRDIFHVRRLHGCIYVITLKIKHKFINCEVGTLEITMPSHTGVLINVAQS